MPSPIVSMTRSFAVPSKFIPLVNDDRSGIADVIAFFIAPVSMVVLDEDKEIFGKDMLGIEILGKEKPFIQFPPFNKI